MGVVVLFGFLGLAVGVVLALIAEAVPDASGGGASPRSCPECATALPASALSPLRTRHSACASCGRRPSAARVPIVVATGVIFAVIAGVIGARWQLLPILVLASSLIALSAVDLARYRLPDRLVFPSLGLSIVLLAVLSISNDAGDHLLRAVVTALAYSFLLFIPNIISPVGLAFGDVKLALLLGLFLGWSADSAIEAARLVIWAFLIGMMFGVLSGILVGIGRRAFGSGFLPDPDFPPPEDGTLEPLLKTAVPFGPALALATLGLVVFSSQFLDGTGILA
jgi:leader peptidase (prepilin peptidase)/N-methyltransferase